MSEQEKRLRAMLAKYEQPVRVAIKMLRRNGERDAVGTAQEVIADELETVLGEAMEAVEHKEKCPRCGNPNEIHRCYA